MESDNFNIGDKVKVVIGNCEIKRGVVFRKSETHLQIIDPIIYDVKDADISVSDFHPENTDWFPISAPDAERLVGRKFFKGIKVIKFDNLDTSRRKANVKYHEVSRN